jgi:hypothetical protein
MNARISNRRQRFAGRLAVGGLLAVISVGAGKAQAQDAGPRISVTAVRTSSDTIVLGDVFALHVGVHLAPGSIAFVPDSILGRGFEPFGPVEWSAADTPDGGLDLSLTYPLIAFQVGTVQVPEFEVYGAAAAEGLGAGLVRDGQPIGDFEAFADNVSLVPSARLAPVPARQVAVASVLVLDEVSEGIAPRPPADVAGGNRDWTSTLLTLLFGAVFLGVTTVTVRDWAASRSVPEIVVAPSPRTVALDSLDDLLAGPLLEEGRTRDFFTRSSEITRRYVEGFEPRWGPAWTGTELMTDLGLRHDDPRRTPAGEAPPDPEPLRREVETAERVKFGGLRPDREAAQEHVRRVRAWIASVPDVDEVEP